MAGCFAPALSAHHLHAKARPHGVIRKLKFTRYTSQVRIQAEFSLVRHAHHLSLNAGAHVHVAASAGD